MIKGRRMLLKANGWCELTHRLNTLKRRGRNPSICPLGAWQDYRVIPVIMKILYTRWKDVNWVSTKSKVFEWQQAIYSASKIGDIKTVRKYQHRIMGSMDAKLLSVRRVTQDNKGKKNGWIR